MPRRRRTCRWPRRQGQSQYPRENNILSRHSSETINETIKPRTRQGNLLVSKRSHIRNIQHIRQQALGSAPGASAATATSCPFPFPFAATARVTFTGQEVVRPKSLSGISPITPYRHQPPTPQKAGNIPNSLEIDIVLILFDLGHTSDS
jgi:hypothetical protein